MTTQDAGASGDVAVCHAHAGWHHHGGFQHSRGPQHEAADHVHRAALAAVSPQGEDAARQANLGICPVCQNEFRVYGHAFDCPLVSPQGEGPGLREAALREATEIIEDIAIVAREDDDSCPLLDELPVELGDRIAAFLNGRAAAPLPRPTSRIAALLSSSASDDWNAGVRAALHVLGGVPWEEALAAAPLPRAEKPEDER